MGRSFRLGALLLSAGAGIGLAAIRFGGATQRACPGHDSLLYETIGIVPGEVAITGVAVATATVEWYDGCNWHTNSFVPVVIGLALAGAGLVVLRSAATNDASERPGRRSD